MDNKCIYRKSKGRGLRCTASCSATSRPYCTSHKRLGSELQTVIHSTFQQSKIEMIDKNNWYRFVHNLLTNQVPHNVILESLAYLLTAYECWDIARPLTVLHIGMKKHDILRFLLQHAERLHTIESSTALLNAIIHIQRKWRGRFADKLLQIRGPWPTIAAVNDSDPYTLEDLTDLQPHTVFSYIDDDKNVFAFHAPEIDCAIRSGNAMNPYTRKPIPTSDIQRLHLMMKYLPRKHLPHAPDTWKNAVDAFHDVCGEYQRLFGIYIQPEWFTCLTKEEVSYVFFTFHVRTQHTSKHMRTSFLRQPPCKPWGEHLFVLGHEMWRLAQDYNQPLHMLWMCMLLMTIAEVSNDMILPDWVFSIV